MITLKAEFHPDYYQLTWDLIHFRIPMKDPIFHILYDAGLMNQYLTIKSYDFVRIEDFEGDVLKVLSTADAKAFVSNFIFHLDNYFSNLKAHLKVPS